MLSIVRGLFAAGVLRGTGASELGAKSGIGPNREFATRSEILEPAR